MAVKQHIPTIDDRKQEKKDLKKQFNAAIFELYQIVFELYQIASSIAETEKQIDELKAKKKKKKK